MKRRKRRLTFLLMEVLAAAWMVDAPAQGSELRSVSLETLTRDSWPITCPWPLVTSSPLLNPQA